MVLSNPTSTPLARPEPEDPGRSRLGGYLLAWRRTSAQGRFLAAALEWDLHLELCGSCLGQGHGFCPEGEHLTRIANRARLDVGRLEGLRVRKSVRLARSIVVGPDPPLPGTEVVASAARRGLPIGEASP